MVLHSVVVDGDQVGFTLRDAKGAGSTYSYTGKVRTQVNGSSAGYLHIEIDVEPAKPASSPTVRVPLNRPPMP